MPDAVILSQKTYLRILKMLEKWEKGDIVQPGNDLQIEETGTGYQKLGVKPSNSNLSSSLTVSDGTNTIASVARMNFIGTLFSVTSGGAGTANVGLRTTNCN